jgi:CheY-like chemotaxis protein
VSRELLLESLGRLTFTTKVRTRTVTALVIDPDAEALGRYRQLLEPDGFRVIAEIEGTAGRQRAIDERPDLIVVDAMLPDVDGFELAATLRHDPQTSAIPIWLTTPGTLAPDAKARLNGNVQGVLERGDEAITALRSWLTNGHGKPDANVSRTGVLSATEATR